MAFFLCFWMDFRPRTATKIALINSLLSLNRLGLPKLLLEHGPFFKRRTERFWPPCEPRRHRNHPKTMVSTCFLH